MLSRVGLERRVGAAVARNWRTTVEPPKWMCQQQPRWMSFKRGRRRGKATVEKKKPENPAAPIRETTKIRTVPTASPVVARNRYERILPWIVPRNFSQSSSSYSREEVMAVLQRFPLWLALVVLLSWDQTSPFSIMKIRGPSMLPTMAADGSEIWLIGRWNWGYQAGDLVGWAHPDHPRHISCKRIIGVEGDQVPRYGQYVHLYLDQDPIHWGMDRPTGEVAKPHEWWMAVKEPTWDPQHQFCARDRHEEARRTITVPPRHVWLEADCPALGIDSRQFGPVPIEWIKGKVVARLWPLTRPPTNRRHRPHPIPLDDETLRKYNVHRVTERTEQ